MKLVCPSCGLTASAEAWINDASARDLLLAVALLPAPMPKATLPYLGLFRPEKRALSWEKAGKLVASLAGLVAHGHVQVQGKVARPCPPRIWAAAMEQMVDRRDAIRRPLPNHNYLKQVAWQLADEEDARGEATRRQRSAGSLGGLRGHNPILRGHDPESQQLIPVMSPKSGLCHLNSPESISPMDAYIQGHRDDKPTEEEMQEWSREKLR